MLPTPIWPLAEHASLGQNCFDASIGSVWFCILDSMPVDACFCKSSFSFHRLVELYPNFLYKKLNPPFSVYKVLVRFIILAEFSFTTSWFRSTWPNVIKLPSIY